MSTMMNGYHFNMAKPGGNEYAVFVNGDCLISGSDFMSGLGVYLSVREDVENSSEHKLVQLIKEFDGKTQTHVHVIARHNNRG